MSVENVTYALQVNATTGNGLTVTFRDAGFVTFKIQGNGPVAAGIISIECCPQTAPALPPSAGSGDGMVWTTLTTIPVPANKEVEYRAGVVSGTFRARISTAISNGSVTVLAVRPEEQRGIPLRPL
jgi:hypothetical protein